MLRRDPGLAAVASFLVWGLGHIYAGRFVQGFLLFFAQAILVLLVWLAPAIVALVERDLTPAARLQDAVVVWVIAGAIYLGTWIWQVQAAYTAVERAALEAEEAARREHEQREQLAKLAEAIRKGQ